jgi:hypothetical protein
LNSPLSSPSLWKPDASTSPSHFCKSDVGAFEIKFLVTEATAQSLLSVVRERMPLDPNANPTTGQYSVEGIYFETDNRDVFQRTPGYSRQKFRVRRYAGGQIIFVERKSKRNGLVSKRRVQIEPIELNQILNPVVSLPMGSDAVSSSSNEERSPSLEQSVDKNPTEWFTKRISKRKLQPTLCIAYERAAFLQMDALGPIRLTVDSDLKCCAFHQANFPESHVYQSFLNEMCIIEFKYREHIPTLFRNWIDEFQLAPQSVSKFRNALQNVGLSNPKTDAAAGGRNAC